MRFAFDEGHRADGNDNGYSFQHPRFGQYFREDYFKKGRIFSAALEAIKAWGKNVVSELNSGSIEPKNVPAYVLNYYVSHLLKAPDDRRAMESLLAEGWQRACFEQDVGYARYSADIAALMDAFHKLKDLDPGSRFVLCVRCGLILSSIRSLGINTPISLLVRLVRDGKMLSRQALHRLRFKDDRSLAYSLPKLFDVADTTSQIEILEVVEGIGNGHAKACALGSLAERLPEPRRTEMLERALTIAHAIRDDWSKARTLESLAEHLPDTYRKRGLMIANEINVSGAKILALVALASHLSEPHRTEALKQALMAAQGIAHNEEGANFAEYSALEFLVSHMQAGLLEQALAITEAIRDESLRAEALPLLGKQMPIGLLERTLTAIESFRREGNRAKALVDLADYLPNELSARALRAIKAINDDRIRDLALGCVANRLAEPHRTDAIEGALAAIARIREYPGNDSLHLIGKFAERMPEEILERVLASSAAIENESARVRLFMPLARRLPERLLEPALRIAEEIQDEWTRASALASVLERLPEHVLGRVLTAAERMNSKAKVNVLAPLAEILPELHLERALLAVEGIDDGAAQAIALCALVAHLTDPRRAQVIERALSTANAISSDWEKATVLRSFAKHLPDEYIQRALKVAEMIRSNDPKSRALLSLAARLSEPILSNVLELLMMTVEDIKDDALKAKVLMSLAERLPERRTVLLERAVAIAEGDDWEKWDIFDRHISKHLPEELLARAEIAVEGISNRALKVVALVSVSQSFSEPHRTELLERAVTIAEGIGDDRAKSASLDHISKHLPIKLLARVEIEAEQISDSRQKASLLFSLASCFSEPHRTELLDKALTMCEEINTVAIDPLGRGVLCLPEPHRTTTLERLLTMTDKTYHDDDGVEGPTGIWIDETIEENYDQTLSFEELPKRVSDRLLAYINRIPNEGSRTRALAFFVKYLRAEYAHTFVLQIPDYLASVSRLNVLLLLAQSATLIDTFVDRESVALKLVNAIQETCDRWK